MLGRKLENIEGVDLFTTVGGVARGVIDDFWSDCASEWSDSADDSELILHLTIDLIVLSHLRFFVRG